MIQAIDRLCQTRANYAACFVGDTAVSLTFLALAFMAGSIWLVAGAFIGGWAAYTLVEWLVHKGLYHQMKGRPRELHLLHHRQPNLPLALPFFATPLLAVVLAIAVPGATSNAVVAGSLSGLWWGFVYYGLFHHLGHWRRFRGWPFKRLWNHHLVHHARGDCNFGVTTMFWDRVFATNWPRRRG